MDLGLHPSRETLAGHSHNIFARPVVFQNQEATAARQQEPERYSIHPSIATPFDGLDCQWEFRNFGNSYHRLNSD
jgi:hypothetical protein